ncbi:tape measure protein [Anaerostipes hadrus]|uniref:tape measure protein n=1 Tax=Anaerostipes hadrus TaxID=649756 RepID=UPI0022E3C24A|nr:tape measure protein [Anaerostipes hadrus]
MANKEIVIDVVSEYSDHASSGLQQTGKNAEKASQEMDKLGKKRAKPKLGLEDKASPVLDKFDKKGDGLGKKTWTPKLGLKDTATAGIKKAMSAGMSFGRKTFSAVLKIDDKVTSQIKKIPSVISKIKNSIFSLKTLAGGVMTGIAAKKLIADPVSLADEFETYQIGFETMLKSKEKATKFMDSAKKFASVTPFDTSAVVSNAQRMLAYGFSDKDIIPDLTKIGNASAALGAGEEGISRVSRALGQMKTNGRLNAEDMNQLTDVGINAWKYLADAEGKSIAQIREMSQKGEISGDKAVKTILNGLKEFDGMMDKTSNSTVSGLMSNIKDTFDINIVSKWGKGLQKGATKGLGEFADYLDKSDAKLREAGTSLEKLGEYASTSVFKGLEKAGDKIDDLISMPKFQNASIGGKISIAWDELIVNPFSKWWDSKGRPAIVKKITGIGKDIAKAGGNWFKESLKDLLPGGDKAGIEDYLAGFLGLSGGLKLFKGGKSLYDLITGGSGGGGKTNPLGDSIGTINVSAAVVNVNGGIGNGNSTIPGTNPTGNKEIWLPESVKRKMQQTEPKTPSGPTRTPGGLFGLGGSGVTLKNGETVAATGWKAWLGNLGVKLGSGAATAGGAAAVGGASLLGGALGIAGIGSAAGNIYNAVTAKDSATKKKEAYRGGTKLGLVGGGAATGALIGSAVPVIGTLAGGLIGAGIGGIGAITKGNKFGDSLRKFVSSRKNALKNSNSMTAKSQEYWKYSKDSISSVNPKEAKYKELASSVQKAYEENKKNTKQTNVGSKTTKIFSGATNAAGGKVSSLGGMSATAGGMLGTMGSMSLAAGGNLQSAGSSALSLAGALASAAATIASAASTTAAQASAIKSITSGSYLSNSGSSKSGKKKTSKKTSSAPKVQTALPKNGKFFHNAKGSLVRGHIVSELGEEGNEMVIPLSRHRSRALSLWNQAGQILGVTKHAKGGLVGGSSGSGKASSGSSQPVINVGGITISVNASGNDGIVDAIKNSKGEIADTIMQAIADAIGSTASNRTAEVM